MRRVWIVGYQFVSKMSTPRHSEKMNGHYISSAPKYMPAFVQRLEEVTGNSNFWNPMAK